MLKQMKELKLAIIWYDIMEFVTPEMVIFLSFFGRESPTEHQLKTWQIDLQWITKWLGSNLTLFGRFQISWMQAIPFTRKGICR